MNDRVVVIDFDNTLVHLAIRWAELKAALTEVFQAYGVTANLQSLLPGIEHAMAQAPDQTLLQQAVHDVWLAQERAGLLDSRLLAGSRELLDGVHDKGYGTVVYSANHQDVVRQGLAHHGLHAGSVIGRSRWDNPKADRNATFLRTTLGARAVAAVIGDTAADQQVAENLQTRYVATSPDRVMADVHALLDHL